MGGKLVIVSAPSGAGKTTIVRKMLEQFGSLKFSISACSRPKRNGEAEGVDYYFLTPDLFRSKIEAGDFVEWEEVYPGSYYGTLRSEIEAIWNSGHHVIFDVDVMGGLKLKSLFGDAALAIFVMPPSVDELKKRLECRSTESAETLATRIAKAETEISFAPKFDNILVNDNLQEAIAKAATLVKSFLDGV
ncbi:MAG TPA: guanylate kinase [Williamwhitmania sp.]|nr:guanylate kinase [Williamwhitmania sp.]